MAKDSSTLLLIGGISVAGYFAYTRGMLNQILPANLQYVDPAVAAAAAAAAASSAAARAAAAGTAPVVPPLGTKVNSVADALAQIKAGDMFVIPDSATFVALQGVVPGGYKPIGTTDVGNIYLRPDVYDTVSQLIQGRLARATAAGADAASIQNAALTYMDEIKLRISGAGLSGLGDFRRHMLTRTGRAA